MEDYKTRLIAEYKELKEKYEKLQALIKRWFKEPLDFTLNTPIGLLQKQLEVMRQYLEILEERSRYENIDLD